MSAIPLRTDYSAADLRAFARESTDANQVRRLVAIAAVYDGMRRAKAAAVGGMDRQSLCNWVHRFNAEGPEGLRDRKAPGAVAKLSAAEKAELSALVEAGPDPHADGVVRWRRIDLKEVIRDRKAPGAVAKLSAAEKAELSALVEAGPDPHADGVVRWRRIDLKEVIRDRFGVDYHERSVSRLLHDLGFSHISARPRHPGQDPKMLETFKKTSPARSPRR